MFFPRRTSRRGFTLLEFIVVLGIISILAIMAVPALMAIVPSAQLRGSARSVVSLMQRARLLADNSQKPARVALDCRTPAASPLCRARLYTAVFRPDGTLDSWVEVAGAGREMAQQVRVNADAASTPVTGNPAGLFWAVFLPTGQMRTSHDPLRLVFSRPGATRAWELALSQASGRATLKGLQ